MSNTPRQHESDATRPPASGGPEVALADYEELAKAWARQGKWLRATSLCKIILRLEPDHEPTRRLLGELDARRREPGTSLEFLTEEPTRDLQTILRGLELKEFQAGETIVAEGEPGDSLFAIVEGSVEVVRSLKSGRRRTVAFLTEGEFFGEMSFLFDVPRYASVKAFERTAVLELKRDRLEPLVRRHPSAREVLRSFHRERLLDDVLRVNPIFRLLSAERKEALAHAFQLHSSPADTLLIEQGKPVDALYLLLRGQCQALHRQADGSESLLRTLSEGDMFGEISLMLGLKATATVRTHTACMLLRLDWESCEKLLLEQPEVSEALARLGNERLMHSAGLFWNTPKDREDPQA
jgi:cAMP-dependent protein kinase regulator